jgi:hypothetical protein
MTRNPIALPNIIADLWLVAAYTIKHSELTYSEKHNYIQAACNGDSDKTAIVERYRTLISNRRCFPRDNIATRCAEKLPVRESIRNVPFYLRPAYKSFDVPIRGKTYVPDVSYSALATPAATYRPIEDKKTLLHNKRFKIVTDRVEGLVRWPETINRNESTFIITKDYSDFWFKVNAFTEGNRLPVTKIYNKIKVDIRAPREFFENPFWGMGDHLVVQVLDTYEKDDMSIVKTVCCDRENLYQLNSPMIYKERYFVSGSFARGTGLTEAAAIKSMQYYMGKDVLKQLLGVPNGV